MSYMGNSFSIPKASSTREGGWRKFPGGGGRELPTGVSGHHCYRVILDFLRVIVIIPGLILHAFNILFKHLVQAFHCIFQL